MDRDVALTNMREVVARWYVSQSSGVDVVHAACDLLMAGFDGAALCMLAGVPGGEADYEVPELLEAALLEVGIDYHRKGTAEAEEAAVRVMAERTLAHLLSPRELTSWVHVTFQHGGPGENLARLDDEYMYTEVDDDHPVTDLTQRDVDTMVMAEVRRLVGDPAREAGDSMPTM